MVPVSEPAGVLFADVFQNISDWIWDQIPRIGVGTWISDRIDDLNNNVEFIFNWIRSFLNWLNTGLTDFLTWPIPLIVAIVVALIAWRAKGWGLALFSFLGLLLIKDMGLWDHAMMTVALVLISAAIAVLIGVPIGILAARNRIVSAIVKPFMDFMQTMPAFVYLIPAVGFFGLGAVPGAVATVVFSMPPAVRLTELGIRQVDEEVVEAGHAFGATPRRILFSIQLPLARPTIMAGINQVIMLSLSMVVIAGMIGADGLGLDILRARTRLDTASGFEAGIAVVIVAVILDRLTGSLGAEGAATKQSIFHWLGGLVSRDAEDTARAAAGSDDDQQPDNARKSANAPQSGTSVGA